MSVLTGLAGIICFVYLLFSVGILVGVRRLKPVLPTTETPKVSVVIAARNEAANLPVLLAGLIDQDYSEVNYEVLIADDRSDDATWEIIQDFQSRSARIKGIQITETSPTMAPKKHALTQAIEASSGEIILTTDGDCRVSRTWIRSMVNSLAEGAGISIGFSAVDRSAGTLLSAYQHLDFMALMTANAGYLGWGQAWSGSGQNLAYRRSLFTAIGGFNPVADRPSGDDVYLVQAISRIAPAGFNSDSGGFVKTRPQPTTGDFLRQRVRWASNSRGLAQTRPLFLVFLTSAFLTNLIILGSLLYLSATAGFLALIFFLKLLCEGLVIRAGGRRFQEPVMLSTFLIWSLLQPIYIPIVGLAGWLGRFTWKNQAY